MPEISAQSLIDAIYNNEFFVAYQGIHRATDGEIVGHEVLLRWIHPRTKNLVSPDIFIPIAINENLMPLLNAELIKLICKDTQYRDNSLFLSINITPDQLVNPVFYELLLHEFKMQKINPENLRIEITEQMPIIIDSKFVSAIKNIKSTGVKIYLDDICSGYMTLSKLTEIDIDGLKLNMKSKNAISGYNLKERVLIEATHHIAKRLALDLVIEHVESQAQSAYLKSFTDLLSQGYFYSRPSTIAGVAIN